MPVSLRHISLHTMHQKMNAIQFRNLNSSCLGCPFCRYEIKGIEYVLIDPFPSRKKMVKNIPVESISTPQSDDEEREVGRFINHLMD